MHSSVMSFPPFVKYNLFSILLNCDIKRLINIFTIIFLFCSLSKMRLFNNKMKKLHYCNFKIFVLISKNFLFIEKNFNKFIIHFTSEQCWEGGVQNFLKYYILDNVLKNNFKLFFKKICNYFSELNMICFEFLKNEICK